MQSDNKTFKKLPVTTSNNIQKEQAEIKHAQEVQKPNTTKFIRQNDTQETNKKFNTFIPTLDLKFSININKNIETSKIKEQQLKIQTNDMKESKKLLTRVETLDTKFPLTSYRNSEEEITNQPTETKLSQSKSNKNQLSPIRTLLKSKVSKESNSNSINSSTDKEELLLLEIKQLKRENNFLKKKIRDLQKEINGGYLPEEYENIKSKNQINDTKKIKKKGALKLKTESLHLTVNLFFEEIRNALNSVSRLFRIELTEEEVEKFQSFHGQEEIEELSEDVCPLRKHEILKKYYLNRKLEKLALEEDEKKYGVLLSIFTEYYTFKEQSEKKVVETIDRMIMYMNDLNNWLIEKAQAKKMKSEIKSQSQTEREILLVSPPKFEELKVPVNYMNYVTKARGQTLSPMPKPKEPLN